MSAEGRERELIAEILAAPHDDVPRLVYADWLIDRGGAWAARGEAIQLEIRAALAGDHTDEGRELRSHCHRLGDLAPNPLFPPEWDKAGALELDTSRGFPGRVGGLLPVWMITEHAEHLRTKLPLLERLSTNGSGPERELAEFAALPSLATLTAFECHGSGANGLGAKGLAVLLASPHWPVQLSYLSITLCELGNAGLELLAASPSLSSVRTLLLDHNDLGVSGIRALGASPHFRAIHLSLVGNAVGVTTARAMAESPRLAALQRLEIAGGYQRTQVGAMLREVYGERLHFRG